jgi:hypothetical protein
MTKKLAEMDRDELLGLAQKLLLHLETTRAKLANARRDLPPNKEANDRHQKHKTAWGRTKDRMRTLLLRSLPHVPNDLAADIHHELDHLEFLYQKHAKARSTSKARRRERRRVALDSPPQPPNHASPLTCASPQ